MTRSPSLVLAVLVVELLGARPSHAEEPTRLPLEVADIAANHVEWYGVYLRGTKVGYVRQQFGRRGTGEQAEYFFDASGRLRLTGMGQDATTDIWEITAYDASPPFAFRFGRSVMAQGRNQQVVEVSRAAVGYSAEIRQGGETRTMSLPSIDVTLADALTEERWVRRDRSPGDRVAVRALDVDDLKVETKTSTFVSRNEAIVEGVRTVWFEALQRSEDGQESTLRLDGDGVMLSIEFGGLFEARQEPEERAKRIEASQDLFVLGQAKVDRPLGEGTRVTRLVLEVGGEGAKYLESGPRQSVTRDEKTGRVVLSTGAAYGGNDVATSSEIADALKETVEFPTTTPQVVELAARAVGDAKTPREKVARLVRFVSDYVRDSVRAESCSVHEIVRSRRGDCSEHSKLFVSLARAAGIPARPVSGLMYMGDDSKAFGGHAWDEVALDGRWVPVDPTWDQMEIDATHLTLERDGKGMGGIGTVGRIELRLKEVEPNPK